jgi:hypothetical protein
MAAAEHITFIEVRRNDGRARRGVLVSDALWAMIEATMANRAPGVPDLEVIVEEPTWVPRGQEPAHGR